MTVFHRDLYAGMGDSREDRADCAVRTLAVACDLPYARVQRELMRRGRRRHTPVDVFPTLAETAEYLGGRLWKPWRPLALRRFMQGAGRTGRWAIFTDTGRHIFAALDGTVHDWQYNPGRRVYCAWRF